MEKCKYEVHAIDENQREVWLCELGQDWSLIECDKITKCPEYVKNENGKT